MSFQINIENLLDEFEMLSTSKNFIENNNKKIL